MDAFRAPDRAAEAGVQWQRIMFDWSAIQRHGPDEWSFGSASAEIASRERIAGRPIVGQFISTPTWASGTSDPKSPPLGLDLRVDEPGNVWAAWIQAVVGRFEGLIDTWVMWNEPDVWSDDNRARQWTGTIEQYYQLLKVGYLAAKSANPNARVMLAGMTYCWDAAYGREQYFERLLRLISADTSARANGWYFDAAVLQLYNNPRGLFDAPRIFHDLMRMHAVDKPVWVNETNVVPWDDPFAPLSRAHFRATLDEQANYLVQPAAAHRHGRCAGTERAADGSFRRRATHFRLATTARCRWPWRPRPPTPSPGFPDAYFCGGAPALVLEPLPSDYQPFAPTYANLPSPGLP